MKKIIFGAIAICTFYTSCDTKDIPKVDVSVEKALMDQKWKVMKIQLNPDINQTGGSYTDITASTDPCILDNRLIFTSKVDVSMDEHYRKCTTSAPQTQAYKYIIKNDNYIKIANDPNNDNDPGFLSGDFQLIDINTFKVDVKVATPSNPNVVTSTIYTFVKTKN
ncbi:MAG TPA: hypothetical protein PKX92_06955 [Edaphocola sp.]|nr:hypothetical protein [Edaphocola sp.]